jgi:predicted nicotinamide N-methyase
MKAARLRARIAQALPVVELPGPLGLRCHTATPQSRLSQLAMGAPYWAWLWPGGAALIAHLAANPDLARGRRVLDLGAGSGMVGIAALKCGALSVLASEVDPVAREVAAMNAALNGVALEVTGDLLDGPAPQVDLVLVGDLFYEAALAVRVMPFLSRAAGQGAEVLIGDIGRAHLPRGLVPVAAYPVRDFGDPPGAAAHRGRVFRLAESAGSGSQGGAAGG